MEWVQPKKYNIPEGNSSLDDRMTAEANRRIASRMTVPEDRKRRINTIDDTNNPENKKIRINGGRTKKSRGRKRKHSYKKNKQRKNTLKRK